MDLFNSLSLLSLLYRTMMANHRHRRPPPPVPPNSAAAHHNHNPLRLEMQPANVHRGKDGMENDNPQQQQQRPKSTATTTTTTSGNNRSSSLRRLTGRAGGGETSSSRRRRAKSVSATTAATTTTSSKMSTTRGKTEILIAGNCNSTTAGGTMATSSATGMVVAIPEPLSFEEFKELRRRRRRCSNGDGGGQPQHQHRTANANMTSGRIVEGGDGDGDKIPRFTPQASRAGKSAPPVVVVAGVATVVDVEKDDDYEDEFTSMIQSLHIDVLNTSTNNNKNNELIKTNERAKMMKARRRVEDMRRRRSSRLDVAEPGGEKRDDVDYEEEDKENNNSTLEKVALVPHDKNEEFEVVLDDPVQCAFEIFRNDERAVQAMQDVFAPAPATTITAPNVVAGAKITVSTQEGGGRQGSGDFVKDIGTVPFNNNEVQETKSEPNNDDNMEEEEENPEKEEERQLRRLRQLEDLSGMVLVIPENWEEVAGFITPKPKSSSSKSSAAVVATAEKQHTPSSKNGLMKSASTGVGDGNSTILTKKTKDDCDEKQHDVDSTRTLSSKPNMPVRDEVVATTVTKKKSPTSTITTGRLPPLRGVSLGGGSMRKKLSSATRRMRRSSSSGGVSCTSKMKEVVPLDEDGTMKKSKQSSHSSTVMTTKAGGMNETNVSKNPQATRIQKVVPAVNAAPDDEIGSYNIAQHFLCDNRRNDDKDNMVIRESSDKMRIHIMDVLPGEGEDVLTPMERDWNSNDRLPDIFRCHDTRDDEKRIVDCSEEKKNALPQEYNGTATNKPVSVSDDKTKDTFTTGSPTHPNSEETTSHPSCETNASSHHLRDNNNNGGLVKSRISQIQQRIEVLSAASLTSDDRISPLSATSIAVGRRKDNNCFIRTVPIGIAKSNKRECLASSSGDGNVKTGTLSYTYSC